MWIEFEYKDHRELVLTIAQVKVPLSMDLTLHLCKFSIIAPHIMISFDIN